MNVLEPEELVVPLAPTRLMLLVLCEYFLPVLVGDLTISVFSLSLLLVPVFPPWTSTDSTRCGCGLTDPEKEMGCRA